MAELDLVKVIQSLRLQFKGAMKSAINEMIYFEPNSLVLDVHKFEWLCLEERVPIPWSRFKRWLFLLVPRALVAAPLEIKEGTARIPCPTRNEWPVASSP